MIDTGEQRKVQYRLRRVGRPATKSSVKDIMKLNIDVTRFGRHSGNDYYLDSAKLECFISRWHAEIHRVFQNGKFHYVLRDTSLNGTYVNNYRFEEYTPDEPEDIGNNVLQPQNRVNHPVVDSTTDVHSSSTCQISVAHCKTASSDSLQATCTLNVTGSKSEPVTSPSTIKSSHSSTASSPVLQDVSNKSSVSTVTGLVPLEHYALQPGSEDHPPVPCNITVHVKQEIKKSTPDKLPEASSVSQDVKASREVKCTPEAANSSSLHESLNQSKTSQSIKSADKKRKLSHSSSTGSIKKKGKGGWPKDRKSRSSPANEYYGGGGGGEGGDDDDDEDDEDEDGNESEDSSWHYDGEKCDAPHCKKPKTKKVSW
ncbi:hypothetical protein LSH36_52g02049, partial [Paralvinella palmiformis]